MNLVSNAVRYTEQGSIHVSVHSVENGDLENGIEVAIADTGLGIDATEQGSYF